MKKFLLVGALFATIFSFSSSAFAAGYGDAGCGLGSLVFGDEQGAVQILAATTNGTFGSQTFGITTGTSNCTPDAVIKMSKEREIFAQQNYPSLVKEMAMGEGENLNTLASLFGCSGQNHADFGAMVQDNFSTIIKNDDTTSNEMISAVQANLANDSKLSQSCLNIG